MHVDTLKKAWIVDLEHPIYLRYYELEINE